MNKMNKKKEGILIIIIIEINNRKNNNIIIKIYQEQNCNKRIIQHKKMTKRL